MSRIHADWDWVDGYPIFIYSQFIDHNKFRVKLVKGKMGNQNAPGFGPSAPAWHEYEQTGIASREGVVEAALRVARKKLREEQL